MANASKNILLGVSGSVAAVKVPELVRLFIDKGYEVSCLLTKGAEQFVSPLALSAFCRKPALSDMFGPKAYQMPHLRYAEEADVMVIAPTSAALMARCAHGLAEDMVALAYITTTAPVIMAPAMHTSMWEHPATQANLRILKERGVHFVGPYIGPLADKTRGEGRMTEPEEILEAVERVLSQKKR